MEWQRQCSMDLLHQHISALLIDSSAALFASSGYFLSLNLYIPASLLLGKVYIIRLFRT